MRGITNIDLATVLAEEHRRELAEALRARPSPTEGLRGVVGRSLVGVGLRLMGLPTDRQVSSASAVGT